MIIKLTEENIKLIAPYCNWFKASREELIELINNLSHKKINVLINSQEIVDINNFKSNTECLKTNK